MVSPLLLMLVTLPPSKNLNLLYCTLNHTLQRLFFDLIKNFGWILIAFTWKVPLRAHVLLLSLIVGGNHTITRLLCLHILKSYWIFNNWKVIEGKLNFWIKLVLIQKFGFPSITFQLLKKTRFSTKIRFLSENKSFE